jgi:Ca2+/Na+ antiporter
LAVGTTARIAAFVLDRPGIGAAAGALELGTFWILGMVLARQAGSLGAAVAVLVASSAYAGFLTWRVRRELPYSATAALRAFVLAVPFVVLLLVRGTWQVDALLFLVAAAGYLALLFATRVVTVEEIAAAREFLRSARRDEP